MSGAVRTSAAMKTTANSPPATTMLIASAPAQYPSSRSKCRPQRGQSSTIVKKPQYYPPPDTAQQQRVTESTRYLSEHLHEVPVHVIPCIPSDFGLAAGWGPSVYPAVWSLMLAFRSRGVGSCMTTSHLWRAAQ